MESVPFAFCDAVCAVLTDHAEFEKLCHSNANYGVWKVAEAENKKYFLMLVEIGHLNGVWSCSIQDNFRGITFEQLKAIDRRSIYVENVRFVEESKRETSKKDIYEIVNFTLQFINLSDFGVSHISKPSEELSELIRLYRGFSYRELDIWSPWAAVEDFLEVQLQTDSIKHVRFWDEVNSNRARLLIEDFALTKPFKEVFVTSESLVFHRPFFRRLFEKPISSESARFEAPFTFPLEEAIGFQMENQVSRSKRTITWRRQDGVMITVGKEGPNHKRIAISFVCPNQYCTENANYVRQPSPLPT